MPWADTTTTSPMHKGVTTEAMAVSTGLAAKSGAPDLETLHTEESLNTSITGEWYLSIRMKMVTLW